ncbi:hypothetical protein IAD21_05352 [Abditibacteriota bacterium]|nr:hypothetical protein IAD21_05352 [Abditibacteriota bacterium]
MDLSLNADAALRAYLSPESWNGYAQHRFVFRTEDGEEEPLLARLALVRPFRRGKPFKHCVILRPERAETTRIFVSQGYWRYGEIWMTSREASRFKWGLFERNLMDDESYHHLSRFCLKQQGDRDVLLRLDSHGGGKIYGYKWGGEDLYSKNFDWHPNNQLPYYRHVQSKRLFLCDQLNLRLLRQTDTSFQRQLDFDWNNPTGEIRATLKWQQLNDAERNAIAFHCQNGDWDNFRSIAALALGVRLRGMNSLPEEVFFDGSDGTYMWIFDYGKGTCGEADLHRDEFLLRWFAALIEIFQPDNINAEGIMDFERPSCICGHIMDSKLWEAHVEPFSQHELMESQLKLREWAAQHFPPEEAQRLLAL